MSDPIAAKTAENKAKLIEQLKKTPIIQIACEKVGIGRASYYRWYKEDASFAEKANEALSSGKQIISDLAESQLIRAIQDGNMTAIIYWLKHQHPDYKTRVELTGDIGLGGQLTSEQQEMIGRALKFASLNGKDLTNNT